MTQSCISKGKCPFFHVRKKNEGKLIKGKLLKTVEDGSLIHLLVTELVRKWIGRHGLWGPSEVLSTVSWSLVGVWKQGHAAEAQAAEGRYTALTLLSSPYVIIS